MKHQNGHYVDKANEARLQMGVVIYIGRHVSLSATEHQFHVLQTADIVREHFPACPLHREERLRERHLGCLHGRHLDDIPKDDDGMLVLLSRDSDIAIPGGGESFTQLLDRARSAILSLGRQHQGMITAVALDAAM
jgi:broad specificity phosphatase PhoE